MENEGAGLNSFVWSTVRLPSGSGELEESGKDADGGWDEVDTVYVGEDGELAS